MLNGDAFDIGHSIAQQNDPVTERIIAARDHLFAAMIDG